MVAYEWKFDVLFQLTFPFLSVRIDLGESTSLKRYGNNSQFNHYIYVTRMTTFENVYLSEDNFFLPNFINNS